MQLDGIKSSRLAVYGFPALPKSSTASSLSQLLFSSSRTRSSSVLTLALFFSFASSCSSNVCLNLSIINDGKGDFFAVL
jgi:hypothetical protein